LTKEAARFVGFSRLIKPQSSRRPLSYLKTTPTFASRTRLEVANELRISTVLFLLGIAQFAWGQTNEDSKLVGKDATALVAEAQARIHVSRSMKETSRTKMVDMLHSIKAEEMTWDWIVCSDSEFRDILRDHRLHHHPFALTNLESRRTWLPELTLLSEKFQQTVAHELAHILLHSASENDAEWGAKLILKMQNINVLRHLSRNPQSQ
jgi:hypothetical protein